MSRSDRDEVMTMNDSRPLKPERSSGLTSRALSRTIYWVLLLVHGVAGLGLLVYLAFFVPKFEELFARMQEQGELPSLTAFVLLLSRHSLWLLPLGFALDAAVLHVLGRLPRRPFWPVVAWFTLVLIALAVLYVLTEIALLLPIQRMSTML